MNNQLLQSSPIDWLHELNSPVFSGSLAPRQANIKAIESQFVDRKQREVRVYEWIENKVCIRQKQRNTFAVLTVVLMLFMITGCGSNYSAQQAKLQNAIQDCNRALNRLLLLPPETPNISRYINDSEVSLTCLKTMAFPKSARKLVKQVEWRAKLILNTPVKQIPQLLMREPFTTVEALLARTKKQNIILKQEVRSQQDELIKKSKVIDQWLFRNTDAGPVAFPKDGI